MTPATNLSRRSVILIGGAGTALALAACSSTTDPGSSPVPSKSAGGGAPEAVAKLADVAVGDSIAATLNGKPILVAQPTAGTVVAFSAICTHQGCKVNPAGAEFHCPCHKSRYDAATGEVLGGPAPRPLTKIPVTVDEDEILAG